MPIYDRVEIFPPIGIARVGDSKEHYLASEDPKFEHPPNSDFSFRGTDGKIKPSVATFHAYLYKDGKPVKEALCPEYSLTWTVRVANKKGAWVRNKGKLHQETYRLRNPSVDPYPPNHDASDYSHTEKRTKLIIAASGELQTIGNPPNTTRINLMGEFQGSKSDDENPDVVALGQIWPDDQGRLLFKAGSGEAKNVFSNDYPDLVEHFDNDDWYDNTCDGNVSVSIRAITDNAREEIGTDSLPSKLHTVVVGAPPKFTSGLYCQVSLYDLISDIYERPKRATAGSSYDCGDVYYDSDIKPIIECANLLSWTNQKANEGHGPHKSHIFDHSRLSDTNVDKANQDLRQSIFRRIRAPYNSGDPNNQFIRNNQASEYFMPRLSGASGDMPEELGDSNHRDRWASLTQLQYDRLKKWAVPHVSFKKGLRPPSGTDGEKETDRLTLAALKWSTGAPLYPGIEVNWMVDSAEIFDYGSKDENKPLFRFNYSMTAGHLTKGNSLPWQADFYMCGYSFYYDIYAVFIDDVVTGDAWVKAVHELGSEKRLPPTLFTKRALWDDGLLKAEDGDERIGASDLVRKWKDLGFVSNIQTNPPIFVEKERKLPREGRFSIIPANVAGTSSIAPIPVANSKDWKRHLGLTSERTSLNFRYVMENDTFIITHSDGVGKFSAGYDNQHVSAFINAKGTLLEWELVMEDSFQYPSSHLIKQKGNDDLRWTFKMSESTKQVVTLQPPTTETDDKSQNWLLIPGDANTFGCFIRLETSNAFGKYVGLGSNNSLIIDDKPKLWDIKTSNGREYQIKRSQLGITIDDERMLFLQGPNHCLWHLESHDGQKSFAIKLVDNITLLPLYWSSVSEERSALGLSSLENALQFEFVRYKPACEITWGNTPVRRQIGLLKSDQKVSGFRETANPSQWEIQWDFTHLNSSVCIISVNGSYVSIHNRVVCSSSSPAGAAQRWVLGNTPNEGEYTISTRDSDGVHLYWTCLESEDELVDVYLKPQDGNTHTQIFKLHPDSREL